MECTQVRELIGADPATSDAVAEEHLKACPACTAYAQRLRASEQLIGEALRFDVGALRQQVALQQQPRRRPPWAAVSGVAAALLAVIAIWALLRPVGNGGPLAADVAEHWYHEPYSWVVTDVSVSDARLAEVVKDTAKLNWAGLGPVTYVQACLFRGHLVPHLVVQGQAGPIMVLLLPHEAVEGAEPLEIPEQGLAGVIVPHGPGSIAILGSADEPLESAQKNLVAAVEWSI